MKLLTVEGHWRVRRDMPDLPGRNPDIEAGLVIEWPGRWLRLFAHWGEAPGSRMAGKHLTTWHTNCGSGEVHGWNLRAGVWPAPCLTLLAHTRPERDGPDTIPAVHRNRLPWDDPAVMAGDLREAIRGIEASGGPGEFTLGALADGDENARMAAWGPCERCGSARDIRAVGTEGTGEPGSGGVYDELWCPACGHPGARYASGSLAAMRAAGFAAGAGHADDALHLALYWAARTGKHVKVLLAQGDLEPGDQVDRDGGYARLAPLGTVLGDAPAGEVAQVELHEAYGTVLDAARHGELVPVAPHAREPGGWSRGHP